jgi:chromate transporter
VAAPAPRGAWREVLAVSLRLGLTSFGGPVAHIGYQRAAFVVRRGWLDERAFAELVALCQALPGPSSSQLSVAVGRLRGGWPGAIAAWVGFTLPSAVLMGLLGIVVSGAAIPETGPVAGLVAGLKTAAVAVVAHAVLAMARRLTPDAPRLAIAAIAMAIALLVPVPAVQPAIILAGAVVGWLAWRHREPASLEGGTDGAALQPGGRRTVIALAAAWATVLLASWLVAGLTASPAIDFLAALVRAGALVFGGGHVVLPLLDAGVVAPGWVTPDAFLAGYGAAQALPGPLFSFGAYLGAVSTAGPGGALGAALATVAIFLPGMLLVLAALPVVRRLRDRPGVGAALAGTNAVVVGLLGAALVTPVGTGGLTSIPALVLAGLGLLGLIGERVPPLVVVVGCSAVMAALAGAGVRV